MSQPKASILNPVASRTWLMSPMKSMRLKNVINFGRVVLIPYKLATVYPGF